VSKDVSTGTQALYRDLESFVTDARRDTRKLEKALERDLRRAQKKLAGAADGSRRASGGSRGSRATRSSAARQA
jgi:hypothetical protein